MSKQSAEEALPLITLQNGKFVLGEQAAHMISSIKGEIGVIGVAGLYRTGKSYVLNRLLGKQDGFAIGPTVNPCTKGIYTWGRPIEATKNGKKIYYILIDTEGIGSIQQDQTYDAKIFSLTLLLSSYFIYNSMGMIDEHALDKLSLVANLTQNIQVKSNSNKTSERELSDYFPGFLWLLRDFSLKLEDESGRVITSSQYLENALQDRPQQEAKNEIRRKLRTMFANRDCVTLVRPVVDESDLQRIDKTPYNKLRPEFRNQMDKVKDKIFDETPTKKILGHSIDGKGFVMLMTKYLESINGGGVPTIHSAWDSVARLESQSALEDSVNVYKTKLQELEKRIPIDEVELKKLETELRRAALSHFEDNALGDVKTQFRSKLEQSLDDVFKLFSEANDRQSEKFNAQLLQSLYDKHVDVKLKAKQFHTSHDLIASWKTIAAEFNKSSKGANKLAVLTQFQTNYLPQSLTQFVDQLNELNVAKIEQERKKIEEVSKRFEVAQQEEHQAKEKAHKFELEAQREAGEKAREKERSQHLEKEKARLENEVTKTRGQLDEAVKQLKSMEEGYKTQVKTLKEDIRMKEDHVKHVQNESQERHRSLQHVEKENQRLTHDIKELRDKLEKETKGHEATSSDLQKKHRAAEQEKTNLTSELERVKDQLKKSSQEKSALEKRVEDLTESLKSNSNLTQKERQTHESNLKAEKELNSQLTRQVKELTTDLQKKTDALEKDKSHSQKQTEQLQQEVKSLQKQLASEGDSYRNRLMQADKEIIAASDAKVKAQTASRQLEEEIKELKTKLAEAQMTASRYSFEDAAKTAKTPATSTTSKKRKAEANTNATEVEMEVEKPEVFMFDQDVEDMSQDDRSIASTNNKENKENGSDNEKPVKAKGRKAAPKPKHKLLVSKKGTFDVVGDTPEKPPAPTKSAAASSRKRKRDDDDEEDEDRPQTKKARVDADKMNKSDLKRELTKMKVQLPTKDSPKKVYVDLFNKKMNNEI
jgi:hypothetical protein